MDTLPDNARVVLIAQNPKSGSSNRGQLVSQLAEKLNQQGMQAKIIQSIDELVESATESLQSGDLRSVVSAGGDGTVSLLVNKLPPETPFYVFPLGTANLLAKYLESTTRIDRAVQTIKNGHTIRLDVGKANDKLFLVVASCGYDADVVHRIHATRKGHINYASYLVPVAQSILGYKFPEMKFVADGKELNSARWAFVLNVPRYAIGLQFIKNADGQDGQLDVCTFAKGGFLRGLGYFFAVLFGQHQRLPSTGFCRFEKLQIESVHAEPVPVELDGDPAGFLPITITTIPKRLCAIVDKTWRPS